MMKAQVTLQGTTDDAVTLSLAAFVTQNVLAGWDTDRPGQAAIVRALGYVPDENERKALISKIGYTSDELPPIPGSRYWTTRRWGISRIAKEA